MKKVLCMIVFALPGLAVAQIQQGLRTSNYGGVNSIQWNPSAFHYSSLNWDLNVLSGGVFFENEYAYVENTSLLKLLRHNGPVLFRSQSPENIAATDDPNALYYNFFDANNHIDNSLNAFIGLPSLSFRVNKMSFGVYFNLRNSMAANNLDPDLDYFSLDRWSEGVVKSIDPVQMAGMLWSEIGLNTGFKVLDNRTANLYAGLNLKCLLGHEGFYISSANTSSVTEIGDTFRVSGGPYRYGIASQGLANGGSNNLINGRGLGADIGFTYIRKTGKKRPYEWRLGLSLVDLGFIRFDQNAQEHLFNPADLYTVERNSLADISDLQSLINTASLQALNNPEASLEGNSFTLYTPSMLSLQFDYAFNQNWFASGLVNRRLNLSSRMVDRENLMAASIRYENRWFEVGVPLSLYDDRDLRAGLWFRAYFLTIGSDHLSSLFINETQFTGSDLYFAIKVNPFSLGNGRKGNHNPEVCNF